MNSDSRYNLRPISQFSSFLVKLVYQRDRVFLNLAQKYEIYNLMNIKPYKIWILLKLKFKNGNQKIVRDGYVKFTLIE